MAFGITRRRARGDSERGAVMIQAAVTMVVLLGFAAFVVDYGVLWLSRDQAQHAADAGALAGAVSLAYDGGSADVVAAATTFVGSQSCVVRCGHDGSVFRSVPTSQLAGG